MTEEFKNASWENKIGALEKLVIDGHHDDFRQLLDDIPLREVTRDRAPSLARLALRTHHSIYALKCLYRFIVPENTFEKPATDKEKMIYAYALLNLGALDEAFEILETVDAQAEPEVLFYKSLGYFKQWNYAKSIPVLKEFIGAKNITPYRRLVGEVNLAAAYICEFEWVSARPLIDKIKESCLAGDYILLLGNSYELEAQFYFFQGQYQEALCCLEKAAELLQNQSGIYLFLVEKWICLCRCFQAPTNENLEHLEVLRSQSIQSNFWDTNREFDLFESILKKDEALVRKIIMGTPSEHYRQRARQLFGKVIKPQGQFELLLGGDQSDLSFDPFKSNKNGEALSHKPHLLAMFEALTLDFYKPSYLGSLFKYIYPDEKFNPSTSPQRLMKLMTRLDRWFEENAWPLRVQFKKSEFALRADAPVRVVIQRGKKVSSSDAKWLELKEIFKGRGFSVTQITQELKVSKSSAQRMIREALAQSRIISVGGGRSTTYRFSFQKKAKDAA